MRRQTLKNVTDYDCQRHGEFVSVAICDEIGCNDGVNILIFIAGAVK